MNDTVAFFREINPDLARASGFVIIGYFAILGLVRLAEIWRSFRTRRAILEEEKLFNEILKIRYEIEALRKQHDLPNLIPAQVPSTTQSDSKGIEEQGPSWAFLVRHHMKFPELPTFTLAPLLSVLRLRFQRPRIGPQRAVWAFKWLLALLFFSVVVVTLTVDRVSPFVGGMLGISGFAIASYLFVTLLYHSALTLIAWITKTTQRHKLRSDASQETPLTD